MKEKEYVNLKCGHCGNHASMEVVNTYFDLHESYDDFGGLSAGDYYRMLLCPACKKVSLIKFYWHEGIMTTLGDTEITVLYPNISEIPKGLPQDVHRTFESASRVKNIDANAYGVLIGRTLEFVCIERKATGDNLYTQLEFLSKNNEIPANITTIASQLRIFRNIGAHASSGELTKDEVPILEDLCLAILEYIYTVPYLVKKANEAMEKVKKL
ncbi:MAG: DUF4145 domain-containing protein [Nitrospinae bacterium]|nr:DUF4145 domain-containing protein [Nitrospinota bacterium]